MINAPNRASCRTRRAHEAEQYVSGSRWDQPRGQDAAAFVLGLYRFTAEVPTATTDNKFLPLGHFHLPVGSEPTGRAPSSRMRGFCVGRQALECVGSVE